jgi:hypothetical protein
MDDLGGVAGEEIGRAAGSQMRSLRLFWVWRLWLLGSLAIAVVAAIVGGGETAADMSTTAASTIMFAALASFGLAALVAVVLAVVTGALSLMERIRPLRSGRGRRVRRPE